MKTNAQLYLNYQRFPNESNRNLKRVLILLLLFAPLYSIAQQTELRASLNSGFFYFGGTGATSVSQIIGTTYTNNPYGSKAALSYGLSLNIRRVSNRNFIFGADAGAEMLRSKVELKYSDVIGDIASDFGGQTYLNTSFLNFFPYLGGRFNVKEQLFDLVGGLDVGTAASAKEKGEAKSTPTDVFHIETSRDRTTLKTDLRPRIQLSTDFGKAGFYVGYAHGLRNYTANLVGLTVETYSRIWRFGATYRLK